jgi:4a-hydroxytetrahydrobiopterin dehydratase
MEYPKEWSEKANSLVRGFQFENFVEAVAFVAKIVPIAEGMNHHPDVEIFSYNKVRIKLKTHDAGNRITEKDVALAKKISVLFEGAKFDKARKITE